MTGTTSFPDTTGTGVDSTGTGIARWGSWPAPGGDTPVGAEQLRARCWEIDRRPGDEYAPHFTTRDAAVTVAAEWVEDDQPVPVVVRLPAGCWVAVCAGCGADMEHAEHGAGLHYPTGTAVDADALALTCVDGCPPPDLHRHHRVDPSVWIDPLPGLDTAIRALDGSAGVA